MNRSFFTSNVDSVVATGSAIFSAKISANPSAVGLSVLQASAYAAVNATFQSAWLAAITPDTRTKGKVQGKNDARTPLRKMASDLAKIINGNSMVTDEQKIELGIAVRGTRSPRPAPGMPYMFAVTLASGGAVTLTWKCDNPKGAAGTMYQVWRRIGSGELTYLGGVGQKKFIDDTLPAGASQVTYKIQAVRSTAVGAAAEYNVNFGVASGMKVRSIGETTPNRIAA